MLKKHEKGVCGKRKPWECINYPFFGSPRKARFSELFLWKELQLTGPKRGPWSQPLNIFIKRGPTVLRAGISVPKPVFRPFSGSCGISRFCTHFSIFRVFTQFLDFTRISYFAHKIGFSTVFRVSKCYFSYILINANIWKVYNLLFYSNWIQYAYMWSRYSYLS